MAISNCFGKLGAEKLAASVVLAGVIVAALPVRAATVVYDDDTVVADNLVLEDEYRIEVAAGKTVTLSGVLSGTGWLHKVGEGKIVLSGVNTYSGGTYIEYGEAEATRDRAFGTAAVTNIWRGYSGKYDSKKPFNGFILDRSRIVFNAAADCALEGGGFPNDFVLLGNCPSGDSSNSHPDNAPLLMAADTTIRGNVSAPEGVLILYCGRYGSVAAQSTLGYTHHLYGDVSAKSSWRLTPYGHVHVHGRLLTKLDAAAASSGGGEVWLYNPLNAMGASVDSYNNVIECMDADVLDGQKLNWYYPANLAATAYGLKPGSCILNGHDQTIKALTCSTGKEASGYNVNPTLNYPSANVITGEDEPCTLTINGGDNDKCFVALWGPLDLVIDKTAAAKSQALEFRTNSTMRGTLDVRKGTLVLRKGYALKHVPEIVVEKDGVLNVEESTNTFAAATRLVVTGQVNFAANVVKPFADGKLDIALGTGGTIAFPEGETLFVNSLTLPDGTRLGDEVYEAGTIPGVSGATIVVSTAEPTSATWTGGGASDKRISTAANWSTAPRCPTFVSGLSATFASGGSEAIVDRSVYLDALRFDAADGFALTGDGVDGHELFLKGDITFAETAGTPLYAIDAPVVKRDGGVLDVPTGTTLRLGDFSVTTATAGGTPKEVLKSGGGRLELTGTTVVDGRLIITNGPVRLSGTITTSSGVDATESVEGARPSACPGQFTLAAAYRAGHGGSNQEVELDNVLVEKPIYILTADDTAMTKFTTAANSTNVFKGCVTTANVVNQHVRMGADSTIVFEGGVRMPWSFRQYGGTVIFRCSVNEWSSSYGWYAIQGRTIWERPCTLAGIAADGTGVHEFLASGVLTKDACMQLNGTGACGYLFHSTTQTVYWVTTKSSSKTVFRGDEGARLIVRATKASTNTSDKDFQNSKVFCPVAGGLSVEMDPIFAGATLTFKNGTSTSTGDLTVRGGTVSFADKASWQTAGNVELFGGRLVVNDSKTFGKDSRVHLATGAVLELASGVREKVGELYVDGQRQADGTYGSPASSAEHKSDLFDGTGILKVGDLGVILLVR